MNTEELKTLTERLTSNLTKGKANKAKQKIERTILGVLASCNTPIELIEQFVNDCEIKNIWSSEEFFSNETKNMYNIFDYLINLEYKPIIQALMWANPAIGSPNAATGDYEVMLLLTTCSEKPTQGDIVHNRYGKKNLKGDEPRIFSTVSGKDLNKKMLTIFEKYAIEPYIHKGIKYGQLLTKGGINHFNTMFKNNGVTKDQVKEILKTWLLSLFNHKELNSDLDNVLNGNQVIWKKWEILNTLFIFEHTKDKKENFMVMNDDGGIYHLPTTLIQFTNELTDGVITKSNQFFRLNQNGNCGVYLKVNFQN